MAPRSPSLRSRSMRHGDDLSESSAAEREQMLPKYESFVIASLPWSRGTRPWRRYLTLALLLTLGFIVFSVLFKPAAVRYGHKLAQAAGIETEPERIPFDEALPATVLDAHSKWGAPEIHIETLVSSKGASAKSTEAAKVTSHSTSTAPGYAPNYGLPLLSGKPGVGGLDAAVPTHPAEVVGEHHAAPVGGDRKPPAATGASGARNQETTSTKHEMKATQLADEASMIADYNPPYLNSLYADPSSQPSMGEVASSLIAEATKIPNEAPSVATDTPLSPQTKDPLEQSDSGETDKSANKLDKVELNTQNSDRNPRKALVLASYVSQKQEWQHRIPKDWEIYRYIADSDEDPNPPVEPSNQYLPTPRNQGREAMAYLTYIIDHYGDLPDYIVFAHGHDKAWHQPEHLADKILSLNLTAVKEEGYVSLRCSLEPGCTKATFFPLQPPRKNEWRPQPSLMKGFWKSMFSNATEKDIGPLPKVIGRRCCAQFAVTKDMILHRPLAFWRGFRYPLEIELSQSRRAWGRRLNKYTVGSVYEMVWHMVFGKPAIYCPSADLCRKIHFSDAIHCDGYTGAFKDRAGWMKIDCDFDLPPEQKVEIVADDEHWNTVRELGFDPWEWNEGDVWQDMGFPGTMP